MPRQKYHNNAAHFPYSGSVRGCSRTKQCGERGIFHAVTDTGKVRGDGAFGRISHYDSADMPPVFLVLYLGLGILFEYVIIISMSIIICYLL